MSSRDHYATTWRKGALLPIGPRATAREFLRRLALTALAPWNGSTGTCFLRPLYCHYVFDDQVDDFERLIIELAKSGSFVDTDTCVDMVRGDRPIDGPYFHLSFDDGLRNVVTNALPVLRKHHIPAIAFVASGVLGAGWELSRQYCQETTHYRGVVELMRWEDLEELMSAGFEVGSHTRTHARFSAISGNRSLMEEEIRGSKIELEDRLNFECKYISWPYGKRSDADPVSLHMTRQSGYRACFGAYRGSVSPSRTNLFSIPRHHFEPEWPLAHVKYFAAGHMEEAA